MANNKIDVSIKDIPEIVEEFTKAEKEISRLNNIINKAIEYLSKLKYEEYKTILSKEIEYSTNQNFVKELLEILKGSDKDV